LITLRCFFAAFSPLRRFLLSDAFFALRFRFLDDLPLLRHDYDAMPRFAAAAMLIFSFAAMPMLPLLLSPLSMTLLFSLIAAFAFFSC